MKAAILSLAAVAAAAVPAAGEMSIKSAREALKNNDPGKAVEVLRGLMNSQPNDPWLAYNAGVTAYAAKDFAKADELWQQLAGVEIPEELKEHVWTQIGNVSYRLGQGTMAEAPDLALPKLEQSREAFRIALSHNKANTIAIQNLALVEKQLEKLYAQLAQRLVEEAKKEPQIEKAIEKLQAALAHQENARSMAPQSPEHQQAKKQIEKMLGEKFTSKAEKTEQQADKQNINNEWQREDAREKLENALADFRQAQNFDAENQQAKEGEQRVQEKLANNLTKSGQQEQREAEQMAKSSPQRALDQFDQALSDYQQALAVKPDHAPAKKGEREVKEQMEKLHMQQGDQMEKLANQQKKNNPNQAGENMLGALEHFEMARDLNPESKEIQDRIDRVKSQLPEMLAGMAKREQQEAAKAEPRSPQKAVAHLERAETALDKSEQIAPENTEAKQMQQQVQNDLSRLREQIAQQGDKQQQQMQKAQSEQEQQENQQNFESMLAQTKKSQEQKEMRARHQGARKYDPSKTSAYNNW